MDREAACAARAGLSHRDVLTWVFHAGRALGLLWGALFLLVSVFVLWLFRTGDWPAQWAVGQMQQQLSAGAGELELEQQLDRSITCSGVFSSL